MDKYIKNLLPRLKQYGQKLNKIESFVDKTWVLYSDSTNFQTFRFQRSGKLLITNTGLVEEHQWEYLPPDSLYIKRENLNGIMYRQAFFLDSLFIMQVEGRELEPVLFYNEAEIPDRDVDSYIFKLYANKNNLGAIAADRKYFFSKDNYYTEIVIGSKIFDENLLPIANHTIYLKDKEITITNGLVSSIDYIHYINSELGLIKSTSASRTANGIIKGAKVCLKDGGKLDGKIKIINQPYTLYIIVENSMLIKYKNKNEELFKWSIIIIGLYAIALIIINIWKSISPYFIENN